MLSIVKSVYFCVKVINNYASIVAALFWRDVVNLQPVRTERGDAEGLNVEQHS